ncbi:MAG: DUF3795 domain-containing protein [Chloroflexota bacterium]
MDEQAQNLTAYCGLNCEECFVYRMTVSEAAKALRRELRAGKVKDAWEEIPFLGEYEPFKKSLDGLAMLRCTKACRGGGGNPWCKIRKCCQKRGFDGCWVCSEFAACGKLKPEYVKNIKKLKKEKLASP